MFCVPFADTAQNEIGNLMLCEYIFLITSNMLSVIEFWIFSTRFPELYCTENKHISFMDLMFFIHFISDSSSYNCWWHETRKGCTSRILWCCNNMLHRHCKVCCHDCQLFSCASSNTSQQIIPVSCWYLFCMFFSFFFFPFLLQCKGWNGY